MDSIPTPRETKPTADTLLLTLGGGVVTAEREPAARAGWLYPERLAAAAPLPTETVSAAR